MERSGPNVDVRLLGGVEAADDHGVPIDLGPPKCRALFAALALSVGATVPVSRLVELVWGDDPPRTAEKTLQSYVTRLRKGLGGDAIERHGAAYRLAARPDSVDASRFQRAFAAGEIDEALAEWTGPPLAGLEATGLTATVDGLFEQWFGAKEISLGQLVDADPAAAIATLTELTAEHPFREGLWALLMTALYRDGRQADALSAYRRARGHLVEEFGVEPGPRLSELEALILGHDERLDSAAESARFGDIPTGTVTFGFSEIDDAAGLWATHRAQMARAVSRHDEIVLASCVAHSGYVFATGGDSLGLAFHRAGDAALWAVALQEAVRAEAWPAGLALRVRVGLHTGEAEERANNYFGPAVNTASAIAAVGHGGQTLVSSVTAALLGFRRVKDLGTVRIDQAASDLNLFQLGEGEHPPLRTNDRSSGNLPRRPGPLFGRDDDLDTVSQALERSSIVTVVGPGGIGKTTLALATAHIAETSFAGGCWLVELADIEAGHDVARAVADTLDVAHKIQNVDRTLADSITARLGSLSTLLILDNCEHVIDGAAELALTIAERCPATTVLATSREGLGLAAEQLVVVGPLETAGPAVDLFAARARSVDPGFDLSAERDAVGEICDRLDGVPLAIELAAARVRTLPPADLVARLDDRLRLLTGGRRRSVERHRTLRATIQWSHDLLTPAEQVLFRRLSIFASSFDLAAVEAVAADDELAASEVNRLLGDLVERSMVGVESGAQGRRFRLLETVRQFAAEQLYAAGAAELLAARHAAYVRDEMRRIGGLLLSNDEIDGAVQLGEIWPNLRVAVDWAFSTSDAELAGQLLEPIALQMFVRRGLDEIVGWTERYLELLPIEETEAKATALLWLSLHYSITQNREGFRRLIAAHGDPDHLLVEYAFAIAVEDDDFAAVELGPRAAAELRARGDEAFSRLFEMFAAAALLGSGNFLDARATHEPLAELFRAEGPPSFLNWTLYLLGAGAAFEGDMALADRYWDELPTIEVPPRTNSPNETLAARSAFRRGRHQEAFRILLDYIDELAEAMNMSGVAIVGIEFLNMMTALGRLDDAAVILGHFDATGLLAVEGPGFKVLIADGVAAVAADPDADAIRRDVAERSIDEYETLAYIRDVLTELIGDDRSTDPLPKPFERGSPPGGSVGQAGGSDQRVEDER
ncbi:MAG: AfsR/SARP family transcriptional regulator [Acidimicrobiales bacterium]